MSDSDSEMVLGDDPLDGLAAHVADAFEHIDDTVFRTGAPLPLDDFARVVDRYGLDAREAADLRLRVAALGLLDDGTSVDEDDVVEVVAKRGGSGWGSDFSSLQAFWRQARTYPLLTAKQEKSLARRYQQGLSAREALEAGGLDRLQRAVLGEQARDGQRAKDTFICCNLRLVGKIARAYAGQGLDYPDLLQEGMLGLIRAVEKFDHTLGYKFSTYATWWIRQSITRGLANTGRTIRLPVHVVDLVRKIIAIERRLCWELEREPTVHDIAERLHIDAGDVAFYKQASQGIVSLDSSVRGGDEASDTSLIEFIVGSEPSVEDQIIDQDRHEHLRAALHQLHPRQRLVLEARYGLDDRPPRTLDEVGQSMHLTRERIRQIQGQAEKQLATVLHTSGAFSTAVLASASSATTTLDDAVAARKRPQPVPKPPRPAADTPVPAARLDETDGVRLQQLAHLDDDERALLRLRFGIGRKSMSLSDAVLELGWNHHRGREVERRAIARLRRPEGAR